jgi:hypothetical protein
MKPTHLTLILLICCFGLSHAFAQNTKTNGYHKVFLDQNLNKTDYSNAYFWGYEFYDDGKIVAEKFPKTKHYKNCKLIFDGTLPMKGNPIALDGTFSWRFKNGEEIIVENTYKEGYTLFIKEFSANELWMLIDFTKKYKNEEGSCYFTDYISYTFSTEKRKKTTCYWYRKINGEWKRFETPCE